MLNFSFLVNMCIYINTDYWPEHSFKLSASACCWWILWVQVAIDIHFSLISHKPHSFPWISAACIAAMVHRNHFFHLHQQNKSSESKVQFRQARNHWKRVLEAAKLAYANKTKESIISQKLGSQDFGELLMFSTKVCYASYYTSYLL